VGSGTIGGIALAGMVPISVAERVDSVSLTGGECGARDAGPLATTVDDEGRGPSPAATCAGAGDWTEADADENGE
jgi:hypothetical protein